MAIKRRLIREETPVGEPGFLGAGQRADTGVTTVQQIPANFNAFLYVMDGNVKVDLV